ncbi:MAG TPA: TetR family transcriptional regulator [Solirubrobacteraceae bacterium]|nr:TetR family transcriptional regulator [Solirubrobacteraceae bacterium]
MNDELSPTVADDGALGDDHGGEHVDAIVLQEMGPLGAALNEARRQQEEREQERRPTEGLRERKRRLTRHRISDVATTLFVTRGFDNVRVADVAEIAGVTEKTIYNYFPTKESLVLDMEDELVETLTRAFRERAPGQSLSEVMIHALGDDMDKFDRAPEELLAMFPKFGELVMSTPSLRSAWLDLQVRLVAVVREELAASAEVDPADPEPAITAHALVGLGKVSYESRIRHVSEGLRGDALRAAVQSDIERAARLLETGLWSFNLLTEGRRSREQIRAAGKAAEEARTQVVRALRQARAAWRELRAQAQERHGT